MKNYALTAFVVITIVSLSLLHNLFTQTFTEKLKMQIAHQKQQITDLKTKITYLENGLRDVRVTNVTVTSYSPRKGETDNDPFINASMQPVREGTVAVSRDLFYEGWVFGRQVYIEGEGIFEIADLMHSRKTKQIDIFRFSTKEALKFGRQERRVALID